MALMFQATSRLKRAVQLINSLDKAKFPLLLSRIIQKLHLRDDRAFSEEEEEKLQIALGLESDDLHIVLETCAFILEQAAYHNAKPQVLEQQLQNIELADEKIQALVELWTSNGKPVVEKLKQRSLAPKQLQAVNWRLNLQMAQSNMAKMKLPNALFELRVSSGSQGVKDNIYLEFTHEELYSFYNQLETIQSQLDSLRS
ncbi:COMM domain-containing protein 10-like [Montipora foliosa]|uniref:COMM domain-containing protein 10-like n=1 Tax=Montipora foliosa TaxID=591990 RepID=UPI0035F1934E